MAHDGTGTGWDEAAPAASDDVGDAYKEIYDVRKGVRIRIEKEHDTLADSSVGGEHKEGSAKVYYEADEPTNRPDGSTALDSDDAGRIWVDSDDNSIYVFNGSSFDELAEKHYVQVDKDNSGSAIERRTLNFTDTNKVTVTVSDNDPNVDVDIDVDVDELKLIQVEERQTSGTDAGAFTSGSWQTRVINTESLDQPDACSLRGSNEIRLAAGTYVCEIVCPAIQVNGHQCRLYNVDDSIVVQDTNGSDLYGISSYSNNTGGDLTYSILKGTFTLVDQKDLRIEHRCSTTKSSIGFGRAGSFGSEVYTIARFWKIV